MIIFFNITYYKYQFIFIISIKISGYNEIAAAPSVENTMRIGTSDVEIVVQSANVVN